MTFLPKYSLFTLLIRGEVTPEGESPEFKRNR